MNPQTLLRSLSAHLSVHLPSATFHPNGFPNPPLSVEEFEGKDWRAFLVQDWYLLGKNEHWREPIPESAEKTIDIQWTFLAPPSPATNSLSPTEITAWRGISSAVFPADPNENDFFWLALHIPSHRPVIHLIKHWGSPPPFIQAAWTKTADDLPGSLDSIWLLTDLAGQPVRIDRWIAATTYQKSEFAKIADAIPFQGKKGTGPIATTEPEHALQLPYPMTKNKSAIDRKNNPKKKPDRERKRVRLLAFSIASPCLLLAIFVVLRQQQDPRPPASEALLTRSNAKPDPGELPHRQELPGKSMAESVPRGSDPFEKDKKAAIDAPEESKSGIAVESSSLLISPDLQLLRSAPEASVVPPEPLPLVDMSLVPQVSLATASSRPDPLFSDANKTGGGDAAPPSSSHAHTEEQASRNSDSDLDTSESISSGIKRSFVVHGGVERHRIGTGTTVVSSRATCQVSLLLEELSGQGVTLTPAEPCSLAGNSNQQWVFALEDEAPELVIELVSQPARRWELWIKTGFREHRTAPIFPLHGDQATRSVERLETIVRWSQSERERLQFLIDTGNFSGTDSPWERRRSLQKLEKELERSMDTWKVIERLSLLLIDHAKLEMVLQTQ